MGLGKVAQPLRVALTGTAVSPPIDATAALIGRSGCWRRLDQALAWVGRPQLSPCASGSTSHRAGQNACVPGIFWYSARPLGWGFGYGAIAQLGERLHGMQEVDGSIPSGSTIKINNLDQ